MFMRRIAFQENSDKSVIELQQYARKNKPNLHILNKLQEEMTKLAKERVRKDTRAVFMNIYISISEELYELPAWRS